MLPINKKDIDCLELYFKKLMPTRKSDNVARLNKWCKNNIHIEKEAGGNNWTFKDVVCASPGELVAVKQLIDGLTRNEKMQLVSVSRYVVTSLYNNRLNKFGAREVLENALDLHVCPYCNRNLVHQIYKNGEHKTTCEFDHFFSKGGNKGTDLDGYSLLAVSFYNLIPSCQYCNRIKGINELKAFYPHMVTWDEADKLSFTYYPRKVDYFFNADSLDVGLKVNIPKSRYIKNHRNYGKWERYDVIHDIDTLNILEVYQNNKREVKDLLWKNHVFSEDYINMMYSEYRELFSSKSEVRNLVIGKPRDKMDIVNTPLGKLQYDIHREIDTLK